VKQVLQDRNSGEIKVAELPSPALLPGGVLVRTMASLISTGTERSTVQLGSKSLIGKARARPDLVRKVLDSVRAKGLAETLQTVRARLGEPAELGYSCAGVVLAVGDGVEDLRVGQRVACAGQGIASHAEVNFVPRNLCVPLPDAVPFDEGAFVALGAIAMHGVRTAGVVLGDHVAVIGLGLVGLLTVQLLRTAGCVVYGLDLRADRAALARELGAQATFTDADALAAALHEGTAGRGADAVLLTASTPSSEPVRLAGRLARDRAVVCVVGDVGLEIPRDVYYEKELDFRLSRSYGPGRYDDAYELLGQSYPPGFVPWDQRRNMQAFLHCIASGALTVTPLLTLRLPVTDAPQAYRRIASPAEGERPPIAIALTYGDGGGSPVTPVVPVRPAGTAPQALAMIGAGNFAQATLLPRLVKADGWRRTVVVTTSGASSRTAAERYGFERAATDPADAIDDPAAGAIVIATRHNTHAGLAERALRAGKAVFVEKPLAITAEELERLVAAIRETGNDRLMVGFNRRFSAHAAKLRAHLAPGAQAVTYRVNAGPLPDDHWTRQRDVGGGRMIGEGCHFIDLMTFLVGSLVEDVHAVALPSADAGSADTVQVNLRYANGAVGHLLYVAAGDPRMPKERVEAFGRGRAGVLENFQRLTLWKGGEAREEKSGLAVDKGFDGEVEAFLRAAREGGPMPIPLEELLNTTWATFAVEQSLAERRAVRVGSPEGGPP